MPDTRIEDELTETGAALRRPPSVRDEVMRRVTKASLAPQRGPRVLGRVGAAAACAIVGLVLWAVVGGNGGSIGPQEAYAAAVANVEKARTFSARKIHRSIEDGKEVVRESIVMFKEPDLERYENGKGSLIPGETHVTDYGKRCRLLLLPDEKKAVLSDISTLYTIDEETGESKPFELTTTARDEVLRFSAQAVKDLGLQKLDGRKVRVLRSDDGKAPTKTVWADPKSGKPVRIELAWPKSGETYTFADIRIDEPLDDSLFSLDPPEGYAMEAIQENGEPQRHIDEMNGKMLSKMMYIGRACHEYASKHDNEFPDELADLKKVGKTNQWLQNILASPDRPDGRPVILYRKPRKGKDGSEIVLYEAPTHRRNGKVVAGMWDGHAEIVDADRFEEMMK